MIGCLFTLALITIWVTVGNIIRLKYKNKLRDMDANEDSTGPYDFSRVTIGFIIAETIVAIIMIILLSNRFTTNEYSDAILFVTTLLLLQIWFRKI